MISTTQQQLIEVYIGTFNRAPDASGLAYWTAKATEDNWSIEDIAKSIFDSEEVKKLYPSTLSNESFLNSAYQNIFGRTPDVAGKAYWLSEMTNGMTKNQMIIALINGAKASTGSITDALLLANKSSVGEHYAIDLGLDDVTEAKTIMSTVTTAALTVEYAMDLSDAYSDSIDSTKNYLEGKDTADTISGGVLSDFIYSWGGDDNIMAGDGDNKIVSGDGKDSIYAGVGADAIFARAGDDTVYAGAGDDTVYGGSENDSIHGEAGVDALYGEAGNDYLYGDDGNDIVFGDTGNDNIFGGLGDDTINGGDGADFINGGDGKNFIEGEIGNDTIYGGVGIDSIYGGADNDIIYGLDEKDVLDGGTGDDTAFGGEGDDSISGNEGDDTLYGGGGADRIDGEAGDDVISGGAGADYLVGGEGLDIFVFETVASISTSLDTIADFNTYSDMIRLIDFGTETILASAVNVAQATSFSNALDLATVSDCTTDASIKWFVYQDNTYIVEDMSADSFYNVANDIVIKLQGSLNLSSIALMIEFA